jgi:hypothetical protein
MSNTTAPVQPQVIDKLVSFDEDYSDSTAGTRLVIKHTQEIPDEHIAALKRDKIDTLHTPTGDFYRVASIPVSVVEYLQSIGFDISQEPIQATLKMLRKLQMDAFITTNKRI